MPARQSRVLRFHSFGEPLDVLCEDHVEVADPPAGTIRVRTIATGLNPADWELCRGFLQAPLPRGVGYDVAGIVDAVGPDLSEGAPGVGDLVVGSADFARQPSAGAADVAILDAWAPVPDGLAPVEAATLPMVVQTAAWTLQAMGVHAGATILVHGAGGMVGHAAVQMALARGAHVLATAGSTYRDDLTRYGAHVTGYGAGMVERVRALPRGSHVDLVLDAARPSPGTIPDLVALAGGDPRRVMTISNHDEARAAGARVNLDEMSPSFTPLPELLTEYAALAARGSFRLPIARTVPFSRWRDAVDLSVSGAPRGKVVLLVAP